MTKSKSTELAQKPDITLQEIVDNYNVVDVEPTHMIIAERDPYELAETTKPDMRELGGVSSTGYSMYGSLSRDEYNPELIGQAGLMKFNQMRKSDGQIKSSLRLVKTPILGGRWYMEPASDKLKDKNISEYVWNCLTKWMSMSWPQFLTESLSMLDFGYYAFEKVFDYNPEPQFEGKFIWKKFSPRHPLDISGWDYDANGGPDGIKYIGAANNPGHEVPIPISKLLVFTFDKEAGNMEGVSILRSAYKHFYYKENLYKVDAIQKERHGIGIPIIKLPANFSPEDKRIAEEMGRNLRTNEKANVVLPPFWDILFAKLEGQPVDCMLSIEHHDKMILRNILGDFEGESGQDMFVKSTRFIADIVRDVFNKYAIPELVKYNFGMRMIDFPELRVRRIGETIDQRTLSFALRNFAGAKFITPDERLEDYLREEMDLPRMDMDTLRDIDAPQAGDEEIDPDDEDPKGVSNDPNDPSGKNAPGNEPGGKNAKIGRNAPQAPKAGMPRQSKAKNMKQQARGTGKKNTGTDNSGG